MNSMYPLAEFLKNETLLIRRIRDYAVERDYSRYISTLEEVWTCPAVGPLSLSAMTMSNFGKA